MTERKEKRGGVRENAGRKAIVQNPVRVTVDIPAELIEKLNKLSKDRGLSRSEAIRNAIEKWLE